MILSQPDLRRAVKEKSIIFDPQIEDEQFGEASIDLRLGFQFTRLIKIDGVTISLSKGLEPLAKIRLWETQTLAEEEFGKRRTYVINPNEFVLAMTLESIHVPPNLIGLVEGRSTYARAGLSMHQTAPWIQPGWSGPIILEMFNNGPLTIELTPKIDMPCQITFCRLSTPLPESICYGSREKDIYQNQTHPLNHSKRKKSLL